MATMANGRVSSDFSNFDRTFCEQTVETLIRCHVLLSALFAYVPKKGLGLYQLTSIVSKENRHPPTKYIQKLCFEIWKLGKVSKS